MAVLRNAVTGRCGGDVVDAVSVAHHGTAVTTAHMLPNKRPRPKKLEPMSIRLDPDVKAALEAIATVQERSLSWVANRALRQWAEAHKAEIEAARKQLRTS